MVYFENFKLAVKQCLIGQKLVGNAKIQRLKMRHIE